MKKFLTILLTLLSIISYSQTKLDMEIFNIINQYRTSKGIDKLSWSQEAFSVSKKHNDYMVAAPSYSHNQPIDPPNHKELQTPGRRFTDADIRYSGVGENISAMPYSDSSLVFIAREIVDSWIASTGHNRLLINETMEFGSVSTSLYAAKKKSYSDIAGYCFSTFNAFR